MKEYMAIWYSSFMARPEMRSFNAKDYAEAKAIAFKMMCDSAGDKIYDVSIYEKKHGIDCGGEYNPHPLRAFWKNSVRNYLTGNLMKGAKRA